MRSRVSGATEGAAHDVAQRPLVLGREVGQRLWRLVQAGGEARADPRAALGDHQHLHAPVVLARAALDETAVLETVDDARHLRVVAAQRKGPLAHPLWLAR